MKERQFKSTLIDGKEVELIFKKPNQLILSKGDFVYRTEFSNAIRAGVMTSAEANKLLKDRGIWNDEKEQAERALRVSIIDLEKELQDTTEKEKGLALIDTLRQKRVELKELSALYVSVTENTAESIASEYRTQFFTSECSVYKSNGKKIFASLEDFRKRMDEQIAADCYRQALISHWEGILKITVDGNFNTELAEDVWLKNQKELDVEKAKTEVVAITPQ